MEYLRAIDHIRKKLYELEVPAYYHPHMPDEIMNPKKPVREKLAPGKKVKRGLQGVHMVRTLDDPHMVQRAAYSIETMIDMHRKKVEFAFARAFDAVDVFNALDRYLLSLQSDVESGNQAVREYAKLVIAFRADTYKLYYAYMKRNPAALETLYQNFSPDKNFFAIMSLISGGAEDVSQLDPLKAKAYPPYPIDDAKPKSDEPSVEESFEASYGVSSAANKFLTDDGKSFNFEDFLNR